MREPHLVGEFAKRLSRNEFRACIRQESLALAFVVAIDDISHSRIKDGITQELQSLVVQRLSFVVALANTLVDECLTVVLDVAGIEAEYLIESRKKLLLLAEREPDSINDVIKPHTS